MNKKVVVVDDDKKVIMLVEKVLKDLGLQSFAAEDGKKALELVKAEKPAILITDMLIPKIHGAELCKMVKGDPELNDTKVIVVTGVYSPSSCRLDMDCNADAYIAKPFNLKDLAELISKQLQPFLQ